MRADDESIDSLALPFACWPSLMPLLLPEKMNGRDSRLTLETGSLIQAGRREDQQEEEDDDDEGEEEEEGDGDTHPTDRQINNTILVITFACHAEHAGTGKD